MHHYTLRVDTRAIGADLATQFGDIQHASTVDEVADLLCDAFEAHLGNGTAPHREKITGVLRDLRVNGLTVGSEITSAYGRPCRPYVFLTVTRHEDIPELTDAPA